MNHNILFFVELLLLPSTPTWLPWSSSGCNKCPSHSFPLGNFLSLFLFFSVFLSPSLWLSLFFSVFLSPSLWLSMPFCLFFYLFSLSFCLFFILFSLSFCLFFIFFFSVFLSFSLCHSLSHSFSVILTHSRSVSPDIYSFSSFISLFISLHLSPFLFNLQTKQKATLFWKSWKQRNM
jgi:hypothetical protein